MKNKVVVLTGAAQGIGAAIAERFAKDGSHVVLVDHSIEVIKTAKILDEKYTGDILSFKVDVTNEDQVIDLYA